MKFRFRSDWIKPALLGLATLVAVAGILYIGSGRQDSIPNPPSNSIYYKGRMAADDVSDERNPMKHHHIGVPPGSTKK